MASSRVPLRLWLAYWRVLQRYHRYTVDGLEHLDGPRAALIVGYHGRPFAYDMCMLTVALYDRLGYLPHGIVHRGMKHIPVLRWLVDGLGFVTGDDDDVAPRRGARRAHRRDARRRARGMSQLSAALSRRWGDGVGYLRLALRHGLPIVPVAAAAPTTPTSDSTMPTSRPAPRAAARLDLGSLARPGPARTVSPLSAVSGAHAAARRRAHRSRARRRISLDDRAGLLGCTRASSGRCRTCSIARGEGQIVMRGSRHDGVKPRRARWAVILGASTGSGAAIARAVARDPGLHVFGVHRGHFPDEARRSRTRSAPSAAGLPARRRRG